jgi:hypothetical protein
LMTVPTAALTQKRRRRSARHATPSPRPHRGTSTDAITLRDAEGQGERARIRRSARSGVAFKEIGDSTDQIDRAT